MKKAFLLILLVVILPTLSAQNFNDALILINGKVSSVELDSIDPGTIESVTVIKDKAAIDIYGEAAKNGVILVITKDFVKSVEYDKEKYDLSNFLIILDGDIYKSDIKSIQPELIKSVRVLKDEYATKLYGDAGRNGVIIITTKKTNSKDTLTTKHNHL